jgi:hypothetical protein
MLELEDLQLYCNDETQRNYPGGYAKCKAVQSKTYSKHLIISDRTHYAELSLSYADAAAVPKAVGCRLLLYVGLLYAVPTHSLCRLSSTGATAGVITPQAGCRNIRSLESVTRYSVSTV